jgi:outer membrane protein assembly factor BamB
MAGGLLATSTIVHESIATGMMGMMLPMLALPVVSVALVASAFATYRLSGPARRSSMAVVILLACGVFALLRTGGISGEGESDIHWRWTATPEERLLAQGDDLGTPPPVPTATPPATTEEAAAAAKTPEPSPGITARDDETAALGPEATSSALKQDGEWPGFRGPERDGIVRGVRIETDWSRVPPVQLWRRPIGPGWSSFAVRGDLVYTQEQRGEDEVVAAYQLKTGAPAWRHRDPVRFWESNGGAGPRATPTIHDGRVYAFGATGILNALEAGSGALVWSRNVAAETSTTVPDWGFSSSPLVIDGVVIVAADATLVAYDAETGRPRWVGPTKRGSYSSPHLTTIDGVRQVLLLSGSGAISVSPSTGVPLWEYKWPGDTTIIQPALMADGNVLVNTVAATGGYGTSRIAVAHGTGGWSVQERWTSTGLKPYFNDFVVHKGHAFGFDGSILACIDLEDGARKWKGGRYGNGQLVLLPDQDVLLVVTEEGELALVSAVPDSFTELARIPAVEGKTWNHPAVAGDVLLVRNGEEMVAFRLPIANR